MRDKLEHYIQFEFERDYEYEECIQFLKYKNMNALKAWYRELFWDMDRLSTYDCIDLFKFYNKAKA